MTDFWPWLRRWWFLILFIGGVLWFQARDHERLNRLEKAIDYLVGVHLPQTTEGHHAPIRPQSE